MNVRMAVLVIVLGGMACTSRMVAPQCSFSDFGPAEYDHLIEQVPTVTVVELLGRLTVRPSDVRGGVWPSGLEARMELHGPNSFREFVDVRDDGTFVRKGLRAGVYCFKVSASGFRSTLGTVVIKPSTHPPTPLAIELRISE